MRTRRPEAYDYNPGDSRREVLSLIDWIDDSLLLSQRLVADRNLTGFEKTEFGPNTLNVLDYHSKIPVISVFSKDKRVGPEYTLIIKPYLANLPQDLKFLACGAAIKEVLKDAKFSGITFKFDEALPDTETKMANLFFRRIVKPDQPFLNILEELKNRAHNAPNRVFGQTLHTFLTG